MSVTPIEVGHLKLIFVFRPQVCLEILESLFGTCAIFRLESNWPLFDFRPDFMVFLTHLAFLDG